MKNLNSAKLIVFFVLYSISQISYAEELYLFTEEVPSAEEMATIMFPDLAEPNAPKVKTRSVQFGTKKPQSQPEPISIGMPVNFSYASYQLKPEIKPFLDQVGVMMNLEKLANQKLIIEGHTDATGPETYNADLSQKRAEAVKDYLIENYQIAAERLIVVGKGEDFTLTGKSPNDPMNRRVEFKPAQ